MLSGPMAPEEKVTTRRWDYGRDLILAMKVDLVKFEAKAYQMFAGKLQAPPFLDEEIAKGKASVNVWCNMGARPAEKGRGRQAGNNH